MGNIEFDDIEAGYFSAKASTDFKEVRENLLHQAMNEVIQQNMERDEFLNIEPETIEFTPNDSKVRTKNYLPIILDAAIALTRLVFGLR